MWGSLARDLPSFTDPERFPATFSSGCRIVREFLQKQNPGNSEGAGCWPTLPLQAQADPWPHMSHKKTECVKFVFPTLKQCCLQHLWPKISFWTLKLQLMLTKSNATLLNISVTVTGQPVGCSKDLPLQFSFFHNICFHSHVRLTSLSHKVLQPNPASLPTWWRPCRGQQCWKRSYCRSGIFLLP